MEPILLKVSLKINYFLKQPIPVLIRSEFKEMVLVVIMNKEHRLKFKF